MMSRSTGLGSFWTLSRGGQSHAKGGSGFVVPIVMCNQWVAFNRPHLMKSEEFKKSGCRGSCFENHRGEDG